MESQKLKLYWVETEDHHEDWFVVATSKAKAQRWFEDYEGYDRGMASALMIIAVPADVAAVEGWAQMDLLTALGGIIKSETDDGRVVEIGGKTYCEGLLSGEIRKVDAHIWRMYNMGPRDD